MSDKNMCENCSIEMELVFIVNISPLYVIPGKSVLKDIHTAKDIFKNKWWRRWVPTKAQYIKGFRCVSCQTMFFNYGKIYSREEAQAIVSPSQPILPTI